MIFGSGNFSNCKECGRKVATRLQKCPHCKEPNPHLRDSWGFRVDYTKSLDPTVPPKPLFPFRIRLTMQSAIPSLAIALVAAIVIDHLFPAEPARRWLGLLNLVMIFVMAFCTAVVLRREY